MKKGKYSIRELGSLLCYFLCIVICFSTVDLFSIPVQALTSASEVKIQLDNYRVNNTYKPGNTPPTSLYRSGTYSCFGFVDLLCRNIYGHNLASQKSAMELNSSNSFTKIGNTLSKKSGNLSETSLKNLFGSSQAGDIVQMDYTTYDGDDSRHTMMVYSISSSGVVFYHAGSSKIYFGQSTGSQPLWGTSGNTLTWVNLLHCLRGSDDGISLYRSNVVSSCSHSYGDTGICSKCNYQFPYSNDRNTSYAGTYKVKSGATAYIRKGPYQKCIEVSRATSGNFTVVARVLNCKGNYWYELSYNGSTCYVVSGNLEKVHTHSYSYGYEAAHPHKQYKKCSGCGEYSYTGATQKVSSCSSCYPSNSTNPDSYTYPTRSLVYQSPTMKGDDVKWVQAVLYQLGYSIDIDGSYGKNSVAIIKQFQSKYGLTVDGHCGPATRAKLLELWNAKKHTHSYSAATCTSPQRCSCGATQGSALGHSYTNNCDTNCNRCGITRSITHSYSNACDSSCNVCGATRNISHSYSNSCDTSCNVCGTTRTITHTYSNDCDTSCNVCRATRDVAHSYSDDCDEDCNNCGATRINCHIYNNDCDISCNVCNKIRNSSSHLLIKNLEGRCVRCAKKYNPDDGEQYLVDINILSKVYTYVGDIDGNNKIEAVDALLILHAIVGKTALTDEQTQTANINGNSKMEATDALLILHYIVEKIDRFPV